MKIKSEGDLYLILTEWDDCWLMETRGTAGGAESWLNEIARFRGNTRFAVLKLAKKEILHPMVIIPRSKLNWVTSIDDLIASGTPHTIEAESFESIPESKLTKDDEPILAGW